MTEQRAEYKIYYSVKEIAKEVGLSITRINEIIREGKLAATLVGNSHVIATSVAQAWIAQYKAAGGGKVQRHYVVTQLE